jgi:hypothetical protein
MDEAVSAGVFLRASRQVPILALSGRRDCQRQTDMGLTVDKRGSDCGIGAFDVGCTSNLGPQFGGK